MAHKPSVEEATCATRAPEEAEHYERDQRNDRPTEPRHRPAPHASAVDLAEQLPSLPDAQLCALELRARALDARQRLRLRRRWPSLIARDGARRRLPTTRDGEAVLRVLAAQVGERDEALSRVQAALLVHVAPVAVEVPAQPVAED